MFFVFLLILCLLGTEVEKMIENKANIQLSVITELSKDLNVTTNMHATVCTGLESCSCKILCV